MEGTVFGPVCFLPQTYVGGGAGTTVQISSKKISDLSGQIVLSSKPMYFRNLYAGQNWPHHPFFAAGKKDKAWQDEKSCLETAVSEQRTARDQESSAFLAVWQVLGIVIPGGVVMWLGAERAMGGRSRGGRAAGGKE